MQVYCDHKMYDKSIVLYLSNEMKILKNNISANIAIQGYSHLKDIDNCQRIFNQIQNKNELLYGSIMQAYNDNKMYDKSIELFESNEVQTCKNNIISNIAIQAYAKLNDIKKCQQVFQEINDKDAACYGSMMQAYNDNDMYSETVQLFGSSDMDTFKDNINCKIAIQAYAKLKDIHNCENVFENMEKKDLRCYSVLMNAYRLNEENARLLDMFDTLSKHEKVLASSIFCHGLYASGDMIALDKGRRVIHKLNSKYNRHLVYDEYILGAILSLIAKCSQNLDKTRNIYDNIVRTVGIKKQLNVVHASMMDCYAKCGDIDGILGIYHELRSNNDKITDEMYSIILNCCAHTGNIDKGIEILEEYLVDNDNVIEHVHILAPIIDCFGRNNQLNDAEYYYNKYSINIKNYKDKILMLLSILSSCKTHNDIERANKIANIIKDIYADNNDDNIEASVNVLLSNIYGQNKDFDRKYALRDNIT